MQKRGLTQTDWVISLGIFLVYLAWFFIIVRPTFNPEQSFQISLDEIRDKFIDHASWEVSRIPIFIDSDIEGNNEPIIVKIPIHSDRNNLYFGGKYFNLDDSRLMFLSDLAEEKNILYLINSSENYQLPDVPSDLQATEDGTSLGMFDASFKDWLLEGASFKGSKKINSFSFYVGGRIPSASANIPIEIRTMPTWTCTASGEYQPCEDAIDGIDDSSFWNAGDHAPQWIDVNLNEAYEVNAVKISCQGSSGHYGNVILKDKGGNVLASKPYATSGSPCVEGVPRTATFSPSVKGVYHVVDEALGGGDWVADREIYVNGHTNPFDEEVNVLVSGNISDSFEATAITSRYKLSTSSINHTTYIFAFNPRIYSFINTNEEKSISLELNVDHYDYYSYLSNAGDIPSNSSGCLEFESRYLDLYDEDYGLSFIFDDKVAAQLCYNKSINLAFNFDVDGEFSYMLFFHSTLEDTKRYIEPYSVEVGMTDRIYGLSMERLFLLRDFNYTDIKDGWNYAHDFNITASTENETILSIGIQPYQMANIYSEQFNLWILDKYGNYSKSEVNIMGW